MSSRGEVETKQEQRTRRGGRRATLFVFVANGLESMPFIGNAANLFVYFYGSMNFSLTKSATMLTNYMGSTFLLSLFGEGFHEMSGNKDGTETEILKKTDQFMKVLGIHVPASSVPVIPVFFTFLAMPIYDRICVPALRKLTGIPTGIRHLQRIGAGLVLSTISMVVAGYVETRRKHVAGKHTMVDSPDPLPMSVLWLGFQYGLVGMADMFTLVELLDC
ncbi:hypothetical protein POM88_011549 [Heracleum sosnowskyi]|uniref:Uncharacterized protein n=1 Tax=Heracleum sosnowskyi TaxID=360622 RepID=A0AAD8N2I3_9APIA|nr:hypothetical protein POM88_011549 [Heracleum sosnowskyi]